MASSGTSIVYQIDNIITGDFYIGVCSGGIAKRRREHFSCARSTTYKPRSRLYNAIKKYGQENFKFSALAEGLSFELALDLEIKLIARLNPAYNIAKGGQGILGTRITEEGRRRLSDAAKSRPGHWRGKKRPDLSERARQRLLENPLRFWQGKKRDEETNRKISAAKAGKPRGYTPPHALAIFAENMRRAARARRQPVRCLTDGILYESAAAASVAYGFSRCSVSRVAAGERKQISGLKFAYVEGAN